MAKLLVGGYIAAVLALIAAAVSILRLHCENFGCMGLGVAWFAWGIGFFAILGLGLFARSQAAPVASLARLTRTAGWLQLTVGLIAVGLWLAKQVN